MSYLKYHGILNINEKYCYFYLIETIGLKDTTQVENLQDQALTMLRNHIEGPHGIVSGSGSNCGGSMGLNSNTGANNTRFGRLLMLLANLRIGNAHRIEKTFFEKIIGNAKMEKLLCDMFQS